MHIHTSPSPNPSLHWALSEWVSGISVNIYFGSLSKGKHNVKVPLDSVLVAKRHTHTSNKSLVTPYFPQQHKSNYCIATRISFRIAYTFAYILYELNTIRFYTHSDLFEKCFDWNQNLRHKLNALKHSPRERESKVSVSVRDETKRCATASVEFTCNHIRITKLDTITAETHSRTFRKGVFRKRLLEPN